MPRSAARHAAKTRAALTSDEVGSSPLRLPYSDLIQLLLDFQLVGHLQCARPLILSFNRAPHAHPPSSAPSCARRFARAFPCAPVCPEPAFRPLPYPRYLARFVLLYREVDVAAKGYLDESAFRALVSRVDPTKDERMILGILERVDPHTHQRISFSDCVCVFAPDIERMQRVAAPAPDAVGSELWQ